MVNLRIRAIREETSARLVREKYQPDVPVAGLLVGGVGATSGLRLRMCQARVRVVRLLVPNLTGQNENRGCRRGRTRRTCCGRKRGGTARRRPSYHPGGHVWCLLSSP